MRRTVRSRHHPGPAPLVVAFLCLLLAGCTTSSRPGSLLYQDAGISVWLDAFPDLTFHATHPISIDPSLLVRVLQGVEVREEQRLLQTLMAGPSSAIRVFSDEQATTLAPLLAQALTTATPDLLVRFQVTDSRAPASEPTIGRLYAYGRSLYVSLTRAQIAAERPRTDTKPGRELPVSSGLKGYKVGFLPQEALRPDILTEHEAGWGWTPARTVVINYGYLAGLPTTQAPRSPADTAKRDAPPLDPAVQSDRAGVAAGPGSERPVPASQEVQVLHDLIIQKDLEIEALKKQLADTQRRLSERTPSRGTRVPKSGRSAKPKSSH